MVKAGELFKRGSAEEAGPILHVYLESAGHEHPGVTEPAAALHPALIDNNEEFRDLDSVLGLKPIRVTWLAPGTFRQYREERLRREQTWDN